MKLINNNFTKIIRLFNLKKKKLYKKLTKQSNSSNKNLLIWSDFKILLNINNNYHVFMFLIIFMIATGSSYSVYIDKKKKTVFVL